MARRQRLILTDREVKAAKTPGRLNDGDGLYLQISKSGSKSWLYMFRWRDAPGETFKLKELGLGSLTLVSLKEAREAAQEARKHVKNGINPITLKKQAEAAAAAVGAAAAPPAVPTFGAYARKRMKVWAAEFKHPSHIRQWLKTFGDDDGAVKDPYCAGILDLPVNEVDMSAVLSVLEPLWSRSVTASRVRGRIERVLDAARVEGLRSGDNPARWEGYLEHILTAPKVLARGHHQAIPYADMPAFMKRLRGRVKQRMAGKGEGREIRVREMGPNISALALEFTILTVSRSSEVILATRREFDLTAKVWTVPGERMKSKRDHRVPLQGRAVEILHQVWGLSSRPDDYVFPGGSSGHLSNMAMAMCLRGIVGTGPTVHGFRSSFRDWAGDETDYAREIAEAALAHIVGDKAEQAYRRGDALERRRALMNDWAVYLG